MSKFNAPFKATSATLYQLDFDRILVEVEDTDVVFRWQITVNGTPSPVFSSYQGIHTFKGYSVVTAYYEGVLKAFIPFKIVYAEEM